MFISEALGVNEAGHLTIGGADALALAEQYGTPLYVMDEEVLRTNMRNFKASMDSYYNGNGLVLFASKAFMCKEAARIAAEEGLGLDVVSGGELYTALQAGFPAERIYFHGNNKTLRELNEALDAAVGHIVVDNLTELETLDRLVCERAEKAGTAGIESKNFVPGRDCRILLRLKPGIDAHTHDFVRTGQIDSKFGFAIETGEAMEAVEAAVKAAYLFLDGFHCHIGSQIFDVEPFTLAAEVLAGFMAQVKGRFGKEIDTLNLGGGFGIQYDKQDDALPYAEFMKAVSGTMRSIFEEHGLPMPYVLIEPGRSIPGPAGVTLYTVGAVKTIPNIRTYVTVDGGMGDNPRYILYGAKYMALKASDPLAEATQTVTIAGRYCESGDLIQEFTKLQPVVPGDILAIPATGAYNYSMASNYNRVPRPPVVMVKEGQSRVIVRGESYEDILRNDV
ncbi:MAG: diaminopimelate decarboxylase [Oscillospiraceae bacterium]|jgi:diaminopimelate decarboxylase|nr:diaminopimelate decarboxylase [Oscillospiraceae bacterium]